jgi:hypothetical protein
MKQKFNVILLGEVWDLLDLIDEKSRDKILYNIDKAKAIMKQYFEQKNKK